MWKKLKKFLEIARIYFRDEESLFLHLLRMKAFECMEDCVTLGVKTTEELEDLVFHIDSYMRIPEELAETKFPEFKEVKLHDIMKNYREHEASIREIKKYGDFLIAVEIQRNVERDFIFEHAKTLPFGFTLR